MSGQKTNDEIAALYAAVSSSDGLLYHVAHARKENSDKDYDGEDLIRIAGERVNKDISKLDAVSELFRQRSLPRDP